MLEGRRSSVQIGGTANQPPSTQSVNHPPACLRAVLKKIQSGENKGSRYHNNLVSTTRHVNPRLLNSFFLSGVDIEEITSVLNERVSIDVPSNDVKKEIKVSKSLTSSQDAGRWREVGFDHTGEAVDTLPDTFRNGKDSKSEALFNIGRDTQLPLPKLLLKATSTSAVSSIRSDASVASSLSLPALSASTTSKDNIVDQKYFGLKGRQMFFDHYKQMRHERLIYSGHESTMSTVDDEFPVSRQKVSSTSPPILYSPKANSVSRMSSKYSDKSLLSPSVTSAGKSKSSATSAKSKADFYHEVDQHKVSTFGKSYYGCRSSK